ncbi:hypothetical protein [Phreatobacter cathodiphilus]|uniref:hypothetical protein n=1 Tax=Phreatobacter cathodiphilus TaxID=1868589 RepID=UPI0011B1F2B9|nr:hypothetical protein [Phreatobacter cathodiphilus]
MKEPPKDSNAVIACIILAIAFLLIAAAIAANAPSQFSDPMGRMATLYTAGVVAGGAFLPAICAILFYYLHRLTLINYAVLTAIREAEHVRNRQMEPVEKLAASLAAKHGL